MIRRLIKAAFLVWIAKKFVGRGHDDRRTGTRRA